MIKKVKMEKNGEFRSMEDDGYDNDKKQIKIGDKFYYEGFIIGVEENYDYNDISSCFDLPYIEKIINHNIHDIYTYNANLRMDWSEVTNKGNKIPLDVKIKNIIVEKESISTMQLEIKKVLNNLLSLIYDHKNKIFNNSLVNGKKNIDLILEDYSNDYGFANYFLGDRVRNFNCTFEQGTDNLIYVTFDIITDTRKSTDKVPVKSPEAFDFNNNSNFISFKIWFKDISFLEEKTKKIYSVISIDQAREYSSTDFDTKIFKNILDSSNKKWKQISSKKINKIENNVKTVEIYRILVLNNNYVESKKSNLSGIISNSEIEKRIKITIDKFFKLSLEKKIKMYPSLFLSYNYYLYPYNIIEHGQNLVEEIDFNKLLRFNSIYVDIDNNKNYLELYRELDNVELFVLNKDNNLSDETSFKKLVKEISGRFSSANDTSGNFEKLINKLILTIYNKTVDTTSYNSSGRYEVSIVKDTSSNNVIYNINDISYCKIKILDKVERNTNSDVTNDIIYFFNIFIKGV